MSDTLTLRLTALDTLFFRESRPFENIGGIELVGTFPPPARTVLGAIRAAIGDAMGVDWSKFTENPTDKTASELKEIIGYGDEYAKLKLNGLWLSYQEKRPTQQGESEEARTDMQERLYPVPFLLLHKEEADQYSFERLSLGKATRTHLGCICLPELPKEKQGFKNLEQHWITSAGLEKILKGGLPDADTIFKKKDLFTRESRLGININQATRSTGQDNGLFQAEHVRPVPELSVDVELNGVERECLSQKGTVLRLGAEGRLSGLEVLDETTYSLDKLKLKQDVINKHKTKIKGLILILLTPAYFNNTEYPWLPEDFVLPKNFDKKSDTAIWQGSINDISLTIHAAVIGKAQREGGWDAAKRQPRPVQSLIPAGSCYYCTVDNGDIQTAIDQLHGTAIGQDQHLGRGRIVCALWLDSDSQG